MSKIFINRPIFAIVIAIIISLVGALALFSLPVARYPQIAPPTVSVTTMYPGASAKVLNDTVASVIESQMVGVQGLDYMTSSSSSSGFYKLTLQFNQGTDPDMDAVNVQNRVAAATAQLPTEVRNIGVTTTKSSGDMAFIFTLNSPNGTYDSTFLKNYGSNYMLDEIKSVPGVGSVQEFGSNFAMRIWLNPPKMAQYGVTVGDIQNALMTQNKQAAAGTIGTNPIGKEQQFEYPISIEGRLSSPDAFGNIVLKKDDKGNLLRLKDVANVNLGAQDYMMSAKSIHKPVAAFAISLTSDANAIQTIGKVKEIMEKQSKSFPPDMTYKVIVDSTKFVHASIEEVAQTFFEALLLVAIIVYLFLQSWRSTVIPMIAVPVSLLGTFAAFVLLGFTINTLTLFAMVLSIGLVVDDAIVVIEAVEYEMKYNGLGPKEATFKAMENVQGPVIGIAFVLVAVFVPVSFMGGMTGILYKQFALTIAVSICISAFVALTLTPALCGVMLKPHLHKEKLNLWDRFLLGFEEVITWFTEWYGRRLHWLAKHIWLTIVALIVFVALSVASLRVLPQTFVPSEDSGYFLVAVNLPDGASLSRTNKVLGGIASFLEKNPNVENDLTVAGFDILSGGAKSSGGIIFASLKDWKDRPHFDQSVNGILRQTYGYTGKNVYEATAMPVNPPPIPGLGTTGGFQLYLINKGGDTPTEMLATAQQFMADAQKSGAFAAMYTTFSDKAPAFDFDVNRDKAAKDGVNVADIYSAVQASYGGAQINDFTKYGKNFKVMIQADPKYRNSVHANADIYVRNSAGKMVPVSNYITPKEMATAPAITRFNNFPAIMIGGAPAPGKSSGEAIKVLQEQAKLLPQGYTIDWAGQAREEIKAGSQTTIIMGLGFVFVFLVLAALYESWKVPFAVLFSVPSGILGAACVPLLLDMTGKFILFNDIYLQIGMLTLVGLAAKNAILIIEYAKVRVDERGMTAKEAAIEAAKIRLRPILMTSLAFILGCIPLAVSSGAGAAARVSMGVTVVAGMTTATFLGIFIIPMLFILIEKIGRKH